MDRNFLTQMSESFYGDFSLTDSNIWDNHAHAIYEINQFLVNIMSSLKMEDVELYRQLHEMNRYDQYVITYHLIENYINDEYPNNGLFDSEDKSLEDTLFEDALAISAASVATTASLGFLIALLKQKYRGPVLKKVTTSLVSLYDFSKKVMDKVKSGTAKARATNAIIYSNLDKCGAKCGIGSGNKQRPLSNSIEDRLKTGNPSSDKAAQEQFNCLFKCYVEYNIAVGQTLYKEFQTCTKNRIPPSMELYINQPENIASQCMILYDNMSKHFSLYKEVIEAIPNISNHGKQLLITAYFKGPSTLRSMDVFK